MAIDFSAERRQTRPGRSLEHKAAALAVEIAQAASRGESIEHLLTVDGAEVLGADVGAGMTVCHPRTYAVAKMVCTHAGFSSAAAQAASSVVPGHPGFVAMTNQGTKAPVRVSDVTSLRWFWTTECYARTDGHIGGRYAMGALLHVDADAKIVLGMHRYGHDFTDRELAAFALLQRPVVAALNFRAALDVTVEILQSQTIGHRDHHGFDIAISLCREYRPTRREAEVLGLVVHGWTNRRIGRQLGITERTVRKHLEAVYEKAGVRGRTAAAVWWKQLD